MNPRLKRAQALYNAELPAWQQAWKDYAGKIGSSLRERIGDDRARRALEWTKRLAAAGEAEAEAVRVFAERRAAEVRISHGSAPLETWETFVEAFEAATFSFAWHYGNGDTPDLARLPSDIPAPPEDPAPFFAAHLAAFDAAEDAIECMALSHLLRIEAEFAYLWNQRAPQ